MPVEAGSPVGYCMMYQKRVINSMDLNLDIGKFNVKLSVLSCLRF